MSGYSAPRGAGWFTLPNLITVLRLVLVVPIVILLLSGDHPIAAVVLAVIFGATDWVDGLLARRLKQESRVGAILDPIADRLGVAVIGVTLVIIGAAPLWPVVAIVGVDVAVAIATLILRHEDRLHVNLIGKIRTAVIMLAAALILLGLIPGLEAVLVIGQVLLAIGAVMHVVAGALYVQQLRG